MAGSTTCGETEGGMKNCTHCKYANWHRTDAGKLHPSGAGRCTFEPKIPELPASKYYISRPMIGGGTIRRRKELDDHCAYFLRKDA